MLDVRKPISLFFFIIGGIIAVYGFVDPKTIPVVTPHGAYQVNLNIPWGGVMMAFALAIGSLALWDDASKEEAELLEKERAEREAEEAEDEAQEIALAEETDEAEEASQEAAEEAAEEAIDEAAGSFDGADSAGYES